MANVVHKEKTQGEVLEGIAFQFCKIATVSLIAGRFVLPVASGLCAIFYVWAYVKGKKDTRCVMRYPLLIAVFWGVASVVSLFLVLTKHTLW